MTHLSDRAIKKIVAKIDGKVIEIKRSKHTHVRIDYYGYELRALFPFTPSDSGWEQKKYNDMRRDLRAAGVWKEK